ncbi:MAG: HD domain-containing protein [Burkholderiales bacterium]|nr:HD domain-containing protein [Burkholderiales bacterium]
MPDSPLERPNPYLLDRVMSLADEAEVYANEDIYTESGMKLLAQGHKLTRALQEKLALHKLQRPLVQTLGVQGGVTREAISLLAQTLIEEQPMLEPICERGGMHALAESLKFVPLDQVSLLMLTLAHRSAGEAMRHAVLVTMVALGVARRLASPAADLPVIAAAGLLHDIGELYVDPNVLEGGHVVSPDEWRSLALHPMIGQRLIRDTTTLGEQMARMVAEHHERFDGSGYPRGLSGPSISRAGQLLAVAEMTVGLLHKALEAPIRLDLALKVISSGHSSEITGVLREVLANEPTLQGIPLYTVPNVLAALNRFIMSMEAIQAALSQAEVDADNINSRELVTDAEARFYAVQRAFLRTGMGSVPVYEITSALFGAESDDLIEAMGIVEELNWRLRDLARFVSLRTGLLLPTERNGLDTLLRALADPLHHGS